MGETVFQRASLRAGGLALFPVPRSATNSRTNNNKERQERNGEHEEGK
jgi:hypothetical protein